MPERVGIVAGCFDLFHAGHVLMMAEAKQHCDWLIVALQTDPTVDRPKKNKPIQGMYERFVQVNACKHVDEIIPYDTEIDLYNLLTSTKINVRFLGDDYRCREDFTGAMLDISIYYCNREHIYSSSDLRRRIKNG